MARALRIFGTGRSHVRALLIVLVTGVVVSLPALVVPEHQTWPDDGTQRGPEPVATPTATAMATATATATATARVFAHYFPPYPISIDNKLPTDDYYSRGYLSPYGEAGKHRAYGGLLRDRPLGRGPLPGNWKLADMRTEVRQAKDGGIDGFTLDILELSGRTWDIGLTLMRAADVEGDFVIIPTLDTSSVDADPGEVATALGELFKHPSAHTIDGEKVLASFLAEAQPVAWWSEVLDSLENDLGAPVKFIAVFNSPTEANMSAFAPISYGLGSWGYRTAQAAEAVPDLAARAHALGMTWMQAVAVQDARPRGGTYAEAGNTETLRATWGRAIEDRADFVQIATWNDYSESTSIAPSVKHSRVFLQLCAYYAAWFVQGEAPAITDDRLFLTHRTQPWAATPTNGVDLMQPTLGGTSVAPRDTVEALVLLTSPATVTLTSGENSVTVTRPAGLSTVLVDLDVGRPSAAITRGSEVVASVVSPYEAVNTPDVQDLQYVAASSS